MDPEKQREIARKGGKASRGGMSQGGTSGSSDEAKVSRDENELERQDAQDYDEVEAGDDADYNDELEKEDLERLPDVEATENTEVDEELAGTTAEEGRTGSTAGSGSGSGKQGFASMDPQKQKEIARKGGKASGRRRQ